MEVDKEDKETDVQTTTRSTTTIGTNKSHSSSDAKSRKELDRWKQKAKDVNFPLLPLLFGASVMT